MTEELNLLGHPDAADKHAFERWYITHAFDYERDQIGSRDCMLQRRAWIAARAEPARKVPRENQINDAQAESDWEIAMEFATDLRHQNNVIALGKNTDLCISRAEWLEQIADMIELYRKERKVTLPDIVFTYDYEDVGKGSALNYDDVIAALKAAGVEIE